MRVQFQFNQDDLVDASIRFLYRKKSIRTTRWQNTAAVVVCSGAMVILIFRTPSIQAALAGVAAALIGGLFYHFMRDHYIKKKLRELCREHYGANDTFICDVELTSGGVTT